MSSDDLIKNLEDLSDQFRKKMNEIDDHLMKIKEIPKAEALIGKCFKIDNSRFTPTWSYYKILSRSSVTMYSEMFSYYPLSDSFTFNGSVTNGYYFFDTKTPSVIQITEKEYNKEKAKFLKKLGKHFK